MGDCDGHISHEDFSNLLDDEVLCKELVEASGLPTPDLKDLFLFVSVQNEAEGRWTVEYRSFIEKLLIENKGVSERSVLRLERHIRQLEQRLTQKFFASNPQPIEACDEYGRPTDTQTTLQRVT